MNSANPVTHLHIVPPENAAAGPHDHITTPEPSDNSLVVAAGDGDRHAFELLVHRHQAFVYRFCLSMLRHEHEAEDATQEVFIRAWQGLKKYRQDGRLQTWLGSIAVNHCRDRMRLRKRRPTQSLDTLQEFNGDAAALMTDQRVSNPEETILYLQLTAHILSVLPENQRAALTLQEVTGLRYDEIAETLSISVSAVKSLIWRARTTLQERFPELLKA